MTMLYNGNNRPLKIFHVTFGLDVGGMEKLLVEIARHADRRRVQLTFVSLGSRGVLANEIEHLGRPVIALNAPEGLRPGMTLRLAQIFRRNHADVVHTHNTKALVYGGPAAYLARAGRLIHTWHGQNLIGSRREDLLFRWCSRLPNAIVTVSADAERLITKNGVQPKKVRTILNGIDTAKFTYAGPQENGPIVTVARLSPEKDIQTLIRAMSIVTKHNPSCRLEIAGDGVCKPELVKLADELNLSDRVRFLGRVDDVPDLLARTGLFVLPSLTEGISLTLLEAMARGLPVVATRVGGNPEVVDDGSSGVLVSPQSPDQLADAILHVISDFGKQQAMGRVGRKRVESVFDIRRMVRDYENLYFEGMRTRNNEPAGLNQPLSDNLLLNV